MIHTPDGAAQRVCAPVLNADLPAAWRVLSLPVMAACFLVAGMPRNDVVFVALNDARHHLVPISDHVLNGGVEVGEGGEIHREELLGVFAAAYRCVLMSVIGSIASLAAITSLNHALLSGLADIATLVDAAIFGTIVGVCRGW